MNYKKRGRREKKENIFKRFGKWFGKLSKTKKILFITAIILVIMISFAVAFVFSKYRMLNTEEIKDEDIIINDFKDDDDEIDVEDLGVGYTNFVIYGSDSRADRVDAAFNTDSIIIVSLNNTTKKIKMVSVYRDTLMDMTNGKISKVNSAYARGGAVQAINVLNMNLDLDIRKHVTVSFGAVADVVDLLGGVTVDISEAEMKAMNKYIKQTAKITGKKANLITVPGYHTLDGVQATTYARIRKGVGDDYARTERQRELIGLLLEKVLKSDLSTINSVIDKVLPQVSTNFTMSEIAKYASNFLSYSIDDTTGFPMERGSQLLGRRGSCTFATTLESNVTMLHQFLYGKSDYQPSDTVCEISNEIEYLVASYNVKPETSTPEVEEPTTPPVTEEPTIPPATEEPTTPPVTEEPTTPPVTEEPTTPPATEEPTTPPVTEEPTTPPATEEPTTPPATEEPTTPPATEEPTTPPATEEPATPPAEGTTGTTVPEDTTNTTE